MTERAVERDDIERYRRALKELAGSASLEQVAEHAGTGETELGYVVACLIVPKPTAQNPDVVLPFALPSAMDAKVWLTKQHWTADDLEDARQFLAPEEVTDDHDTAT